MKQPRKIVFCAAALGMCLSALGQAPVISSFTKNGVLLCTNLVPGTAAAVEWAPVVDGPWTNNWAGLGAVTVDANGMIQVSVPMFYRVRGTGAPSSMVLIPAGWFTMGNSMDPSDGYSNELPLHSVYLSAFYMDANEVSQAQWDEIYQWAITNGYSFEYGAAGKATDHPPEKMTWYDTVKWCNARSEKAGLTPAYYTSAAQTTVYRSGQLDLANECVNWTNGYRLPTEAEWEKAARGGTSGHRFPWAEADTISHGQANYEVYQENGTNYYWYDVSPTGGYHPTYATGGEPYTSPVGSFAPNGYGLYDMAGNVWEWCWDWFGITYYSSSPSTDPRGPNTGVIRVSRGGSWRSYARLCRAASRAGYLPDVRGSGFRCVRGL